MALSDDGVYRWRVLMCSDQYIAGDTAWDAPTRLALNEWGYIYIPMSAFISGGNGFDKKCFVSVTFNKPQDGNADNVKEVRFADFELIKAAEGELVADKYHAGDVIKEVSALVGGRGGGRPNMAQAGGSDVSGIDAALAAARERLGC